MKAVIMAGGEGTRLRPLSLGLPKPMVNLFDKPVLAYILKLLRENGVLDACLTLRYMPKAITDYVQSEDFGINLTFSVEETPLGTAGGVRACADFIGDDDFLVISGDCVCDFDLKSLMTFHKEKNAEVTIALYDHPEPLEYGLVVTHGDGRIEKFIEKPPWENVVTSRVNTGIYIISPSALADITPNKPYDFGKDLFPALLGKKRALYGMTMSGYWCDIGSPGAYLKCCTDILSGRTRIKPPANESPAGVFAASPVHHGVNIIPPVYIGSKTTIMPGASIGPNCVIESASFVAEGAEIRGSVLGGAAALEGSRITDAIVCRGAGIGRGTEIYEAAVIGEGCDVGANSVITQSVKLWPGRKIEPRSHVTEDITVGMLKGGLSFTARGVISGAFGTDFTPPAAIKLGEAAGGEFLRTAIGHSGGEAARVIAQSIACGINARGGTVLYLDTGLPSCVSYAASCFMLPLALCVNQNGNNITVTFFGKNGSPLPHDMERRLLAQGGTAQYGTGSIGSCETIAGITEFYTTATTAVPYAGRHPAGTLSVRVMGTGEENRLLRRALIKLGCIIGNNKDGTACFEAGDGGMTLTATCEDGRHLSPEQTLAVAALIEFTRGTRELTVPPDAPNVLDTLAARFGASIIRTGSTGTLRDGIFQGTLICGEMAGSGVTLSELAGRIPGFSIVSREIPLRQRRAKIMAALSAAACETGAELSGGIGLREQNGFVKISPLRDGERLVIRAEAGREEIAEELCADITNRIKKLDGN